MRRVILLAAAVFAAVSSAAFADNTLVQKEIAAVPPVKAVKPVAQKASNAVRLSEVELDRITAGTATHVTGGGITVVFNPGHASVLKFLNKNFVCINCVPF